MPASSFEYKNPHVSRAETWGTLLIDGLKFVNRNENVVLIASEHRHHQDFRFGDDEVAHGDEARTRRVEHAPAGAESLETVELWVDFRSNVGVIVQPANPLALHVAVAHGHHPANAVI